MDTVGNLKLARALNDAGRTDEAAKVCRQMEKPATYSVAGTIPHWAALLLDGHKRSRELANSHGHDVSRISIGYYDGLVKVCDDSGAYEQWLGSGGNVSFRSVGAPSRALEAVFYHRDELA